MKSSLKTNYFMRVNNKILIIGSLLVPLVISQCKEDPVEPTPEPEPTEVVEYDATPYTLEYGAFPEPNFGDNPLTEQGVKLGRMLFYETMLSQDNSISCSSCHKQEDAFTDVRQFSEGVGGSLGKRQAMSVFNTAWHDNEFFWDGRAHLLRDQALLPIQDDLEMKEMKECFEKAAAFHISCFTSVHERWAKPQKWRRKQNVNKS